MTLSTLSPKQKEVLKWCHKQSTRDQYDAIICDGAVRSGKTIVMIVSFIHWAMRNFNGHNFGICGKTVRSAERNIIMPLQQIADITDYYEVSYTRSVNLLTVTCKTIQNRFYIFGGKDESSYMLVQGITLAGVLFDEVALMPRSFVDQAIARTLSVSHAKLWFNCNPENPMHWFRQEWLLQAEEKRALHLHFLMTDNPILTPADIEKAERTYTGTFHDRYILGKWVIAEGLVYPMFSKEKHVTEELPEDGRYFVSIDYGTSNPCSMGLWCIANSKAYRIKEYYYSGRKEKQQKTDEEYYTALENLVSYEDDRHYPIERVIIDPSAASFIECIRRHGRFSVVKANNDVLAGIRRTAALISNGKILLSPSCKASISEFGLYGWDDKKPEDTVIKDNDHAMDDIRYFVNTILSREFRWDDWS